MNEEDENNIPTITKRQRTTKSFNGNLPILENRAKRKEK